MQIKYPYNNLKDSFPASLSDEGLDLLNALFTYDPSVRITARDAVHHKYFQCSPYPQAIDMMPTFPTQHDKQMDLKRP